MALVICPDCKTKVSDDAAACPNCGRPKIRNGVAETWKKDGLTPGGILGACIFLGLLFAGFRSCSNWLDSGPSFAERKNTIVSGVVAIPADQVVYYKLDIKPEFTNTNAKGHFTAAGGSGNDIDAFIADETDTINWKNGHKYQVFWQTDGLQTMGSFDLNLKAGVVYYLVLSNKASVVSDKQVTIDATLTFREPVSKPAQ